MRDVALVPAAHASPAQTNVDAAFDPVCTDTRLHLSLSRCSSRHCAPAYPSHLGPAAGRAEEGSVCIGPCRSGSRVVDTIDSMNAMAARTWCATHTLRLPRPLSSSPTSNFSPTPAPSHPTLRWLTTTVRVYNNQSCALPPARPSSLARLQQLMQALSESVVPAHLSDCLAPTPPLPVLILSVCVGFSPSCPSGIRLPQSASSVQPWRRLDSLALGSICLSTRFLPAHTTTRLACNC